MPKYELDKAYSPEKYEPQIYKRWEDSGAFKPNLKAAKDPFSIIMPPPNANGDLHLGHAMFVVEDILTRYRRMQGHPTLWLPGTDHAGIETQVVFERQLAKEGKSRFNFTPAEFYDAVMAYTRANQSNIINQLRSLGFSADWSRLKFTLDDDIIQIVYDTFKQMHKDGLVYRANRIVNWCPRCNAAFADIEIKHREQQDPLYYIKYGPFVLATVRPETKFGDTAVAVNPKDERYTKYVGTEIDAESVLGHKFKLKVIADDHVDPAFGTGAVKVTPAHDPNDWEMGLRHGLEVKSVIGTDGRLTELAGKYAGMLAADARTVIAADMEAKGLMDHVDMNYTHSIAVHDRCGTPIEPLVTEQWWLKVDELKQKAIAAVKSGEIKIIPARFEKVYIDWLQNLRDWNISRQIWWGIRIPVYYRLDDDASKDPYLITESETEAREYYGEGNYAAETDTFDTWFSSSQWPFATLGYPDSPDFKTFYPTTVMETGRDILFQWVSRMVMLGLYRTGEIPFRNIYLHGLVNDEHGRKMSKSKGNVLNPLELTAKYGTDALRLALTIGITPGNDGALSERKIEGYRNFCNKLWNVARFIIGSLPDQGASPAQGDSHPLGASPIPQTPADAWILARVNDTVRDVTQAIEDYRFSEAGQIVYSLLWDDFADWYIEASKVEQNPNILYHSLSTILILAHPIAPFVTEAIWSALPGKDGPLITTPWPEAVKPPAELLKQADIFEKMREIVRNTRTKIATIQPKYPKLHLEYGDRFMSQLELISKLTRLPIDQIKIHPKEVQIRVGEGDTSAIEPGRETQFLPIGLGYLAIYREEMLAYKHRLTTEVHEKQAYLRSLEAKLANKNYLENAPEAIVADTRNRQTETQTLLAELEKQIATLD